MGCYGCVFGAELFALWLIFCALCPGSTQDEGQRMGKSLLEGVKLVLKCDEAMGDLLPLLDDGGGLVA